MEMALRGQPDLAKDVVRCMSRVFREPKPIMEKLMSVSSYQQWLVEGTVLHCKHTADWGERRNGQLYLSSYMC